MTNARGAMLTGSARRSRRGVGFLWFTMIGLPVLFLSAALSMDVARIVMTQRQVAISAESAAIAGAFEFETGTGQLRRNQAESVARETFDVARSAGAMDFLGSSTTRNANASATQVSVSVSYQVTGLRLLNYLAPGEGDRTFTLTRTADVCIPGQYAPTGNSCSRPDAG